MQAKVLQLLYQLANQFQLLYLQVKVLQHLSQQASVRATQHLYQLAKALQLLYL